MYELPLCSLSSKGKQISSVVALSKNETITNVLSMPPDSSKQDYDIVFCTRRLFGAGAT